MIRWGENEKLIFWGFTRNQYIGGIAQKKGGEGGGGLDSLQIYGAAWQERGGGVFERGLIPQ